LLHARILMPERRKRAAVAAALAAVKALLL
jgi:hypothetical protein